MNLNISATSSNMVQHLSNRVQHLSNIIQHLSNIFATFPNTIQMDYIWKTISATNRPYLIQTDYVGCKPPSSDTNRLYRIHTDTSWSKLIQTDTNLCFPFIVYRLLTSIFIRHKPVFIRYKPVVSEISLFKPIIV